MKQKLTPHRRAIGLLLAAVALPLTPALAQDVAPAPAQPPIVDVTPPAAEPAPPPVIAPVPESVPTPPPVATTPTPAVQTPVADVAPTTRTRTAPPPTRRTAPTRPATTSVVRTPAPAATAPAPAPTNAPLAAAPATSEAAPLAAPEPAPAPEAAAPVAPAPQEPAQRGLIWPWLLGALVLVGGLALLLRRRRRDEEVYYEEVIDEPETVVAPAMTPAFAEDRIAPPAMAPEVAAAASGAAAVETGSPDIGIEMRPVRAGVNADDAVVQFKLTVDNHGDAAARDVRISTWMFAAGHASEAERTLIQGRDEADLPAVTIASGGAKRIESTVALSTANISQDSVLPVVVAEASYRLPDGSEAQTTRSFEVGVPIDGELAYFDVENPSGLHDDVEARPHRENVDA
jgi:hypothetical protein